MKRNIRNQWKVALAAGVITSLGLLPQARAELVYEPEVSPNAPVQVREQDREATRQDLESSVKAQDTVQAIQAQPTTAVQPVAEPIAQPVTQYVAQQPVQATRYVAQQPVQQVQYVTQQPVQQPQYVTQQPVQQPQYVVQQPVQQPQYVQAQPAPVLVAPAPVQPVAVQETAPSNVSPTVSDATQPQPEVESLSKAELMRRERTRTELQNEDLLEERLEELRLRDEKKRTDELLGDSTATQEQPVAPIQGLALPGAQPQSQVVVSPVTDRPGQPAPQVVPLQTQYQTQYTTAAQDQINMGQAQAVTTANASSITSDDNKPAQFYISPRAGISSLNVNSSLTGVTASGLYSLGIALGTSVSDNVGFEVGYTNSQYGINLGQMYMIPGLSPYSYQLNQNVIDATLKLYLLGQDSRIRPFVGVGGGYEMSSLNYPSQLTSSPYYSSLNNLSPNTNGFLGELEAGMDVKISKTISVGAMFKYADVFSSNSNNNLPYYGGGAYGGAYGGYAGAYGVGPNAQQQLTAASLSQASFYSVLADLNFSF